MSKTTNKKTESDLYIKNPAVFHDYTIDKSNIYEAGIALEGWEIKSVMERHTSLQGAYCRVSKNCEIAIIGMYIKNYSNGLTVDTLNETRERKLLLHKTEIRKIQKLVNEKGWTVVPINIHRSKGGSAVTPNGDTVSKKRNIVKIDIAVAKGATKYDKRQKIKEKDIKKTVSAALKNN